MAALKGVKTIDMVGGEITKVSYEGAEYERVEGDAKVGDLLSVTEGIYHENVGEFFECYDVDCDGDAVFDDGVCRGVALERSTYVLFRKKPTRLKVGDYAKVVDEGEISITGDIVKITEDDHGTTPFRCAVITGKGAGDYFWACESELVHATEAEVATAKEAEAKRSIEAKWAKIGRKVDEYKVGDIVSYADTTWFGNSGIGEVSEGQLLSYQVRIVATDRGGFKNEYYLSKGRVTLITPVEARFDRS
ncbi:hypothetical protein [Bacillus sp. FSL P2-0092]|uniref:hypothetical protein n=1 Tax=Bacillus sp. FSL P2-0092 TaxID=2921571 RepID=UPI0030F59E58